MYGSRESITTIFRTLCFSSNKLYYISEFFGCLFNEKEQKKRKEKKTKQKRIIMNGKGNF